MGSKGWEFWNNGKQDHVNREMRRSIRRCRCRKRRRFCCPYLLRLVQSCKNENLFFFMEANENHSSLLRLGSALLWPVTGRVRSFDTVSSFLYKHARRLLCVETSRSSNDQYKNGVSIWAIDETVYGPLTRLLDPFLSVGYISHRRYWEQYHECR